MVCVLHVIVGLGQGGAETALLRLLSRTDPARFSSHVVSLTDEDALVPQIAKLGIPVHKLGLPSPGAAVLRLATLWREIRRVRPDVIQGWMTHGNLAGMVLARIAGPGRPALVWGIRQSVYDLRYEKPSTARLIQLSARLSRQPLAIVYNSRNGRTQHEALGFSRLRGAVIPNGFDVSVFGPSGETGLRFRRNLNLPENARLVGIVGRYQPMKDHSNFIAAAGQVLKRHPECRFLMVGQGMVPQNEQLAARLRDAGVAEATYLLGSREDLPAVNSALDVAVSSSYTEGFSNAIGEAMSCGVPCVVTGVGDSALLVGNTGIVVPPRDPEGLASGINRLLDLSDQERRALGGAARARVVSEFSLDKMADSFSSLYLSLLEKRGRRASQARTGDK